MGDNAGAFLGPLLAAIPARTRRVLDIRSIFYLAVIPGLLAFVMVLLVRSEPRVNVAAKIENRHQPAAVSERLLEVSAGSSPCSALVTPATHS